jgi:hypothetical protein
MADELSPVGEAPMSEKKILLLEQTPGAALQKASS